MQRIFTTTTLLCLSLLSLQGYTKPDPNTPINSQQQLNECVAQKINELFYPNNDTHNVRQLIPEVQRSVLQASQRGFFSSYIQTTYGQTEKLATSIAIKLLIEKSKQHVPDILEQAANELANDLQARANNWPNTNILANEVVANNLDKKLIGIMIQRLRCIYP